MTGEDKETTVTGVTFLSTKQQLNHSSKAKDAGTSTNQKNHKTNVGENLNKGLGNRIKINWQLMINNISITYSAHIYIFGKMCSSSLDIQNSAS